MNILILNNFWRYPGTERWDFELVCYEELICHDTHQVTYIVNRRGRTAITAHPDSCKIYEVEDFNDSTRLAEITAQVVAEQGPMDRVIAFSENLLLPAARLREAFAIPGPDMAETLLARDKMQMKQYMHAAGVKAPRFLAVLPGSITPQVASFVREVGLPVILKPADGASSIGVSRVTSLAQLETLLGALPEGDWQLEEFIAGDIYHIDGLVDAQGELLFSTSCRYINTCLDFSFDSPLGGVMVMPGCALEDKLVAFARRCLSALGFNRCAFHLEVFLDKDEEPVFLEVGARVAGADVPYMIEHTTGVNLFKHWVDLILHDRTELTPEHRGVGAWLMFGLPEQLPQQVNGVTEFVGKIPSVYRQHLPQVGSELIKEGGYCALQSGRFLFSSPCATQLAKDVEQVLQEFHIDLQTLEG
ncbi:ATP-grasp domain-containing protein [Pseudoalteromonas viridis]|uniref:ATP-grasp domain-containing protein n=1 Tax=Pseudoalteromonas viridis TaxID=339617 RepID=A0ABX7VAQ4_9GAMM|nr:ATP-grasp domain-containing protein [Pseudoalteromonas viridis]QTL36856.1 ATP-grasp domain-containing protein [Pseudoalteromonas viridis]